MTPVVMPPLVSWLKELNALLVIAVTATVGLYHMVLHAVKLLRNVIFWSIVVESPRSALQICTYRMDMTAITTSRTVFLEHVSLTTASVNSILDQVCFECVFVCTGRWVSPYVCRVI